MISFIDATDEMFGVVNTVLIDSSLNALLGYAIDVRWPGNAKAAKPDMTKLWARVSKQVVTDEQAALANALNERPFETKGLLYVQLFCPRNQPATLQNGRKVAVALQKAFRRQSPSGEVWFLNQAIRELAETDENYPITVVTEFQYTTLDPINVLRGELGTSMSFHLVSAAGINATLVKNSAGVLSGIDAFNNASDKRYLKLFDVTHIPDPTVDLVKMTIGMEAGLPSSPLSAPVKFDNGIAIVIVRGIADNDVTPVGVDDVVVDLQYQ